jgi:hypothetical protein
MNKDHIDNSLSKVRVFFEEASEIIDAIKPGEKIPATVLAAQIAEKHGLTGPALYPVLKFLFDGYPGITVKRGAQGGLARPAPVKSEPESVKGE